MKPEEWFGVAARAIGLFWLVGGLGYLLDALLLNLGYFNHPDSTPAYFMIIGLFQAVFGLYLLRGAPLVIRWAHPVYEEDDEDEEIPEKPTEN